MQATLSSRIVAWLVVGLCGLTIAAPANTHALLVAGYIENVWFNDGGISFKAKMDSGAKTSSINAVGTERYKRANQNWVRFSITNAEGKTYAIDAPVKRTLRIRRAGTKVSRRLVIELPVCIGGHHHQADFSLVNRQGQNYQILIGREFLAGRVLIKSSETFLVSGKCELKEAKSR